MKKSVGDERLMVKVCNLYYKDDMKQDEIAKLLGLSRPTISRILKEAKEIGIVKIEIVNPFNFDYQSIERILEKKFSLNEVIVVEDQPDSGSQKMELGRAAAKYLERVIKDSDIVGVSMGTTVKEIANYVDTSKPVKATFVPLIGGVGQLGIEIHPNQIVIELAKAFGGDFRLLHAPALISGDSIKENLKEEKGIKQVMDVIENVNVAIVGLGIPRKRSTMMDTGYYNESDLEVLKKQKAVGDICLQFYNIVGNASGFEFNKNVFGIEIERLKTIEKVIGVVGGIEKVDAIRGAIHGRFINVLITNYSCALELEKKL